jgi:hypothetical protein
MIERFKSPKEDIEALLPWFEKGTLPPEEARLVEQYLQNNSDELRYLELIREEADETITANEMAGIPSRSALDRLMADIAAEPKSARAVVREKAGGFFSRLFGQGTPAWVPVATGLACLVILVQAAAIGVLFTHPQGLPGPGGSILSGGGDPVERVSDNGRVVLIRFTPNATAEDISTLLRSLNATIVEGPKPGNVFRVRISNQPLSSEQIEAILKQMRERSDIIERIAG